MAHYTALHRWPHNMTQLVVWGGDRVLVAMIHSTDNTPDDLSAICWVIAQSFVIMSLVR